MSRDVDMVTIKCKNCEWNGTYKNYRIHLQECHADISCPKCPERFYCINHYQEHIQEKCPERLVSCGFDNCATSIRATDLDSHYRSSDHQMRSIVMSLYFLSYKKNSVSSAQQIQRKMKRRSEMMATLDTLIPNIGVVHLNCQRSRNQSEHLKFMHERFKTTLQELIEDQKKDRSHLDRSVAETGQLNEELETYNKSLQNRSLQLDTDSCVTFGFKLTEENGVISIPVHEPRRFYTCPSGYEFTVHANRSNHHGELFLSVNLTLMRSIFDDLIIYPFDYPIFIILMDLTNQGKHIVHRIDHTTKPDAFHRPVEKHNKPYMILDFAPGSVLKGPKSLYVADGMFYIRVFIDFLCEEKMPFRVSDDFSMEFTQNH